MSEFVGSEKTDETIKQCIYYQRMNPCGGRHYFLLLLKKLPVNPMHFLRHLQGNNIIVKLKCDLEYRGKLAFADAYMNLKLVDVKQFATGKMIDNLKKVLIRCDNILYIQEVDGNEAS